MKVGQRVKKQVYLTNDEVQYIEKIQNEYGYNFSRMCRYALLHLGDVSAKKKIEVCSLHNKLIIERVRELAAIGNNINQIAHQVNIFAIDGKIPETYLTNCVLPAFEQLRTLLSSIDSDQKVIKRRLYT